MTRTEIKRAFSLEFFEKISNIAVSRRGIRLIVGSIACVIGLYLLLSVQKTVDKTLITQEPFDTMFFVNGLLGIALFVPGFFVVCLEFLSQLKILWLKK